ncbi:MarR family transcriptional regulator [Clavibacter sp. CT19]|uniref:MarR family transcriptional regulator n=1 Tax=unclassified Clavibacter TaxID=2626594 RepID=UPI0022EAFBE3|nr:MarR family transcriptional regulator [Clavibacter sp. CT19]MDA3803647.1 MarR family transcriptional regulator [Clavibacter sp. CT19]
MPEPRTHERLVISMSTVFDLMDAATLEAWVGLTGLQIQLVRVVATDVRVDRTSLAHWTRTSRAALVPSLSGLLQRRILAEESDDDGSRLLVAPAGRRLLEEVLDARVAWIRDTATAARPPIGDDEVREAIAVMERLADRV